MRLTALALTVAATLLMFSVTAASAVTAGCVLGKICYGTRIDDRLTGTNGDDEILAEGGRDFVNARGGSDVVQGGAGADGGEFSHGGLMGDSPAISVNSRRDGDDIVHGGIGRDTIYGFGGDDLLVGGGASDYIFAEEFRSRFGRPGIARSRNPGKDTVSGGGGGDHIEAVDGRKDVIACGSGKDAVWFDEELDAVSTDCELRNIIHSGG
jgi:Ca2+-binding RTX toxin-like protein